MQASFVRCEQLKKRHDVVLYIRLILAFPAIIPQEVKKRSNGISTMSSSRGHPPTHRSAAHYYRIEEPESQTLRNRDVSHSFFFLMIDDIRVSGYKWAVDEPRGSLRPGALEDPFGAL
jgi:hypothetical protein